MSASSCPPDSENSAWRTAALARLADARVRNRRIGHRKSRGGCKSCKARKIKCDETYPECTKCTKAGRRCNGYATASPSSPSSSETVLSSEVAPSPASSRSSWTTALSPPPSQNLLLSDIERRPFDFFLARAAPKLGGPFDAEFWTRSVLQIAQAEPYVKDCVLAISILYEHPQYTKSLRGKDRFFDPEADSQAEIRSAEDERSLLPPFLTTRHAEALRSYNRAVSKFRNKLNDGTATPALALLSCILFACIDVMRDHVFGALDMITQGARLIQQHGTPTPNAAEAGLISTLAPTILRMSTLAAVYGFTSPLKMLPRHEFRIQPFTSVGEARDALFVIMGDINLFVWEVSNTRASYEFCPGRSTSSARSKDVFNMPFFPKPANLTIMNGSLDPKVSSAERNILEQQKKLAGRLYKWYDCFQNSPQLESINPSGLLMYYHTIHILLNTHLQSDEMQYDDYTDDFRQILEHAEAYITDNAMYRSAFTFETGAVAPLHVLADKCRIPSMRRKALQLIDLAPRKENMWGAAGVGQLCARIIAIEEEGLGLPVADYRGQSIGGRPPPVDDGKIPSKENRASYLELVRNATGEFEVRITRYREKMGSGDIEAHVQDYAVCD